jgi:hypothetical protein
VVGRTELVRSSAILTCCALLHSTV